MIYQLAPLESVSCWAFRVLCSQLGADRTYTEMVRAKGLARNNKASWSLLDTYGDENCHVQLMAVKPREISRYFERLEEKKKEKEHSFLKNIKGYNLNLGCPSPDVIREGGGAALMKRVSRVCDLIESFEEHTSLPISIKIRLGMNKNEFDKKVYLNLLRKLNELTVKNFQEVIVHLKHAKENSTNVPHYEIIDDLMDTWEGKLILNGGYSDTFLPQQRVYGVMFARAAIKDPLLFSRLKGKTYSITQIKKKWKHLCSDHKPKQKYVDYLQKNSNF